MYLCSQFPTEAMQWIKEVELVDSVDDLRNLRVLTKELIVQTLSCSTREIASALNRIIQNTRFKKKVSLEEHESPQRGPFPSRKTDCLLDLRILPGHWAQ